MILCAQEVAMNSRHGDLDRAVTRGGPTMEFVERSGVDNLASIRPCAYCGKPAAYRDLAGQPAHTTCAGESSEEKLHAKINTSESRAMTTNMTIGSVTTAPDNSNSSSLISAPSSKIVIFHPMCIRDSRMPRKS
jgi:hypothetical protein